jgi:hypothetical protein
MSDELQLAPLCGSWDSALLGPVAEINEQMLDCLRAMAVLGATHPNGAAPRLISVMRAHWCRLDARAQRRLSACPYLLLDAGFANPKRWERVAPNSVMDAPARGGYFGTQTGIALIRRTLLLAWHLARANRVMAGVILGMSAVSAQNIARSQLRELDALAELAPGWIAPRWEQQPIVWQQLISAACSDHPLSLRQAQLRGLQLLAREQT